MEAIIAIAVANPDNRGKAESIPDIRPIDINEK
jgi:hypothetical protein